MPLLGQSRTVIRENHAFIAPDGHVNAPLAGWTGTQGIILISPHMRGLPRFSQYIALMAEDGQSALPLAGVERFVYVMDGEIIAQILQGTQTINAGEYLYLPANIAHQLTALSPSKLLIFEKPYQTSPFTNVLPEVQTGKPWTWQGEPFLGDEDARLRVMLPTNLPYDMAVNLFTFQRGTALPFVETHIMEHGLYLLEGQGIYRLDDAWYPIQAGDAIWMGSYCPQWFCAIGKTQSTYIYYKDVNRDALT